MTDPSHAELAAVVRRVLFLNEQATRAASSGDASHEARTLSMFYDGMDELSRVYERQPLEVRVPIAGDRPPLARFVEACPGPVTWPGAEHDRD